MSPKNAQSTYEDFEIEVHSNLKGGFEARVLRSPRGRRVAAPFKLPLTPAAADGLLARLEGQVRASSRAGRDMKWDRPPEPSPGPLDVAELGRSLFRSLFAGTIEKSFREARAAVDGKNGEGHEHGLAIRLAFDDSADLGVLASLPWELLCDDGIFLNRCRRTPMARSLNRGAIPVAALDGPLRVLLVAADPSDLPTLDTGREASLIERKLREQGAEVEVLEPPSIRELRRRLQDGGFHVLHFMGHGGVHADHRDGFVLCFVDRQGRSESVPSLLVAELTRDVSSLRLVVLNSCWSGTLPRRDDQDPFTGVASALVAAQVPAVVAMQFPISDAAAIAFSTAFYRRLAAGDPVAVAAAEGRLAIHTEDPASLEWATPVVLLAGEDVRFDLSPAGGTGAVQSPEPPLTAPLRLAVRSFRDPYLGDNRPPDLPPLDLTEFFNGRQIREAGLWQSEIYPRLRDFLVPHIRERTPLVLDLAAHLTIAFAAGYILEAKSGMDVTVLQRSLRSVERWQAEAGPVRPGALWAAAAERPLDPERAAVAVALGVTHDIAEPVEHYCRRTRRAVGTLWPATVPVPGNTSVEDGRHALLLAQDLAVRIRRRSFAERLKPLHLFAAAPNALVFFLGQMARSFGAVQLQHDFESGRPDAYRPSLRLPVP